MNLVYLRIFHRQRRRARSRWKEKESSFSLCVFLVRCEIIFIHFSREHFSCCHGRPDFGFYRSSCFIFLSYLHKMVFMRFRWTYNVRTLTWSCVVQCLSNGHPTGRESPSQKPPFLSPLRTTQKRFSVDCLRKKFKVPPFIATLIYRLTNAKQLLTLHKWIFCSRAFHCVKKTFLCLEIMQA